MPPKHHCMIVFNEYPVGETRVQRQAEALLRDGYEVDVICKRLPGQDPIDSYKGVQIFREKFNVAILGLHPESLWQKLLEYFLFFFSAAVRLNRLFSKRHYDSIQVHNIPDFLVFCTFLQKSQGVPILLDLHDLMPEFFAGRFGKNSSILAKLIHWQESMSCRYATHIITVSEHWRQALISRGVPESKCSVVMNVADTSIFHPRESQALRMNNSHSFRLIYHGSMVKRYGIDLAIQSVNQLRNETPGIHLSLIGQGDFLPDILELISSLNLHDQVTIQKKCLAEDLPDLILACDLGIVPYRNDVFTDGLLPTKLMEYAALGLPVVASRTTAIQTHFSGMNVEFFEPGSVDDLVRVIRLLQHQPDRIMELKRGCQNFNERFDWTKISAEYVGLVDSLSQIHQEAPAMAVE